MRLSSPSSLARAAVVVSAAFAFAAFAQSPTSTEQAPAADAAPHHHEEPVPTNLKVLPKDSTGEQVHQLMHKWEAELGTECSTCHAADPTRKTPSGRPALNYADDSKPEKNTARLMYKMVEDINKNYVSMVDNTAPPVSCGTCHRGHLDPPLFTPTKRDHDHDHPAPEASDHPASTPQ